MNLVSIAHELGKLVANSKATAGFLLQIIAIVWLINELIWLFKLKKIQRLGLRPRSTAGLIGFFTSPVLHSNREHLLFNAIPFFALATFILTLGINNFYVISAVIIFLDNLLLWLLGRPRNHIGASGLISGYFSFIIIHAYENINICSLFAAFIAIYYFGGIFLGIFPNEDKVSWEGHLFGFLAGIASYFLIFDPKFNAVYTAFLSAI